MKGDKCLGNKEKIVGLNNNVWLKMFEKGVKIRKKFQGEITLDLNELALLSFEFKELAGLYSIDEIDLIGFAFPDCLEFVQRVKKREISYEEADKIKEGYYLKVKMMRNL